MMRSRLFSFLIGVFILMIPSSSFGQVDKANQIENFLRPFINSNQFAGQILAAEDGKVIYEKAFGLANADFKIKNQLNTRIGIASITKSMTKVILFRLIESKKISLEDKLYKYIPDFPSGDKITIEMLARHRSGIPHRVMPTADESINYTSSEFIEKVKKAKLDFEPGTKTSYSSAGYSVLARALEIAAGKSYQQLLQEYVFGPADMKDSLTFKGEMVMERRAQDYYPSPDGMINVPLKDYSFLIGAGSVFSTARDTYKFGEAILNGTFGDSAKASLIGKTSYVDNGSTGGHRAYIEIENNNKYGYVIVANMSGAFDSISRGISEILQGKPLTVSYAAPPKVIHDPNKDINEFTGHYQRTDGNATDIVVRNGYLYSADIKLYPIKPDCFFEYRFFGTACFIRDAAGKINEIKWKGVGWELSWIKQ